MSLPRLFVCLAVRPSESESASFVCLFVWLCVRPSESESASFVCLFVCLAVCPSSESESASFVCLFVCVRPQRVSLRILVFKKRLFTFLYRPVYIYIGIFSLYKYIHILLFITVCVVCLTVVTVLRE